MSWFRSPRVRGVVWYATAPVLGLLLYWRAFSLWFVLDDFAWLGLPAEARVHGLSYALFTPFAQGTVRLLSDRLFFFIFSTLFGLHALPYHLWVLATWAIAVMLVQQIGERLTHSRVAGLLAALLWVANTNAAPSVAWASAYNQVLCGALLLAAFYSRLRGWRAAEWAFYLLGFGALEVTVMYPFLAILYALCADRKRVRDALWLLLPAFLFSLFHFLIIPKSADSVYALAVDRRLPGTIKTYLAWMFEPGSAALQANIYAYRAPEKVIGLLLGFALVGFTVRCLMRRQWLILFFCGWFVLLLAPYLPLPRHLMFYYLTLPSIGLCWMAGWALRSAWGDGGELWLKIAATGLAAIYLVASAAGVDAQTRWYQARGQRMRRVMEGVAAAEASHPGSAIAFEGADEALVGSGFEDRPFRLVGADRISLAPDVAPEELFAQAESGQARVLDVSGDVTHDVTEAYEHQRQQTQVEQHPEFVDVGNPAYAARLGSTWYPPENGYRWMPRAASLFLSGPGSKGGKLLVTGFAPQAALASGPVSLLFRADNIEIGSTSITKANQPFSLELPLPARAAGQKVIEISIESGRTFRAAGDNRDLGMVFGTFRIE